MLGPTTSCSVPTIPSTWAWPIRPMPYGLWDCRRRRKRKSSAGTPRACWVLALSEVRPRDGGRVSVSETYDVVVAGAGHNSLVAAAYLAKAGLRCLVLEARPVIGGDTATEELTLPGFQHDTCSTAHNLIQVSPTLRDNELHLDEYGLEYIYPDPVVHIPFPDGTWLTQWRDLDRTGEEFAKFSRADADVYLRMIAEYDEVKGVFGQYRYPPIGLGPSLEDLLAQHPQGSRWLRRQAMSAWDIIRANFQDWHTRAFMLWMSFMTVQPIDRPGTGWLAYSITYGRQRHSWTMPRGGSHALPRSLERILRIGPEFHRGVVATDDPVLLVVCPTVADPSRAPAGKHSLKIIGFQPYELPEGPERWDEIKEAVSAANLAHLRRYAPNLTDDAILAVKVKSPLDLERFNMHNWHGSCHGGDMGPAQSGGLRPAPGWAQHRMPIPGLYQTGATTHPGGSVSAAPGRNGAMVMLADFGMRLEAGGADARRQRGRGRHTC